jgi:hypothetical protein
MDAAKEGLIGPVQARQHILQDVGVDGPVLCHLDANALGFGFLLVTREGDVTSLPGGNAPL